MKTDPPTPNSEHPPSSFGAQPPRSRGKVFDVMRPGKAPASPTSRPVIMGHKTSAQATQVRVSGVGAGDGDSLLDSHSKAVVKPSQGADALSTSHANAEAPVSAVVASTAPVPDMPEMPMPPSVAADLLSAKSEASVAALQPKKGKNEPEPAEKPIDPAKLDEAALDPEPPVPAPAEPEKDVPVPHAAVAAEADIHEAAAPNLEGQVVVSHHTTAPSGTGKLVALIVLMLLFGLLVLDILLDAGVVNSSIIPHTNFF